MKNKLIVYLTNKNNFYWQYTSQIQFKHVIDSNMATCSQESLYCFAAAKFIRYTDVHNTQTSSNRYSYVVRH